MSLYGAAGFPLRDGIPRGSIFVDFMRMRADRSAPPSAPTPSAPAGNVPGGFDDAASETTLSSRHTPQAGGVVRTDAVKQFSDGSRRTEVMHKHPDGSFDIATVRRSLPDAEGFEKVRVWSRTTAPDGSKDGEFSLFRVPAGMQMDWGSADAQPFLVSASRKRMAPDGSIIPDLSARAPDSTADASERRRDETPAGPTRRPTLLLAP